MVGSGFWRSWCDLLTEGRLAYEGKVGEGSRLDSRGSGLVPNEGLEGNLSCRGRHVGFIVAIIAEGIRAFARHLFNYDPFCLYRCRVGRVGKSTSLAHYGSKSICRASCAQGND